MVVVDGIPYDGKHLQPGVWYHIQVYGPTHRMRLTSEGVLRIQTELDRRAQAKRMRTEYHRRHKS